MLRPYSHLNYAWDEPSLPHKLVLSLPGNRVLGVFELDKVLVPVLPGHLCSSAVSFSLWQGVCACSPSSYSASLCHASVS